MYRSLEIEGFRGFGSHQRLDLAIANGTDPGSGLTIIVGENNSGKSSIIEALRSFTTVSPRFSEGQRNKSSEGRVRIVLRSDEAEIEIASNPRGGAIAKVTAPPTVMRPLRILALPSRRHFDTYFASGGGGQSRDGYERDLQQQYRRSGPMNVFLSRLVAASDRRAEFDRVLGKLINPVPDWVIEQNDLGHGYIKVLCAHGTHSTEGAGEGLLSLLSIADALYDSSPGDVIAIDEPELSLHPAVLRRLSATLGEYSKDRQIILSTHSPYFPDPTFLFNGGELCRLYLKERGSVICQVQRHTIERLKGLALNRNNPHVLGLDAREIFFQNDKIILVEGQDDVLFYPDVENEIGLKFEGSFFGWGVGGAENMPIFTSLLKDLDFSKVVGVLDSDKAAIARQLRGDFPQYLFVTMPAPDVRTKPARRETPEKLGLLNGNTLRQEFRESVRELITSVNEYLEREAA